MLENRNFATVRRTDFSLTYRHRDPPPNPNEREIIDATRKKIEWVKWTAQLPGLLLLIRNLANMSKPNFYWLARHKDLLHLDPLETPQTMQLEENGSQVSMTKKWYHLAQNAVISTMQEYGLDLETYEDEQPTVRKISFIGSENIIESRHYPSQLVPRLEFIRTVERNPRTRLIENLRWSVSEIQRMTPVACGFKMWL